MAVRGADSQWAVWAQQINLGPGAKAGLWIGGDNPEVQGRQYDTVPNVIVINSNLHVTNASIQRNAPAGGTAAVLRVYNGPNMVAELLENGTLRVKAIEMLP
jgi:DNA gyrase inhibitor GyrI